MTNQNKIVFPKDVVIGKYYKVPHIFSFVFYNDIQNVYLPIATPVHEDKEYINFEPLHYHVDWRFLPERIYNKICVDMAYANYAVRSEVSKVICVANSLGEKNVSDGISYKTVKCKRWYLNNTFESLFLLSYQSGWPVKLQKAYCGSHLRLNENGQYVCPHKGAIIDLKHIDEDGNAICPAHLLKFDPKTLKAI